MIKIPDDITQFLERQHFFIISSLDKGGIIHTSAKGGLNVQPEGKIFVLDLYKGRTYRNIKENPNVTLTVIDEQRFRGYSIRGRAKILSEDAIPKKKLKVWHDKLSRRIAKRMIRHIKDEYGAEEDIPEATFPFPKYIIEVSVSGIVDLAPRPPEQKGGKKWR